MPFQVIVHAQDDLIEVVYPPEPTVAEVAEYIARIKQAIVAHGRPWDCLVDQRQLKVLSPELARDAAKLDTFAEKQGRRRSARVVNSSVASLQADRKNRDATPASQAKTFQTREEALAWLRSHRPAPNPSQ